MPSLPASDALPAASFAAAVAAFVASPVDSAAAFVASLAASIVALAASLVASAAFAADSLALSAACCAVGDCWPQAASVAASVIAIKAASVRVFIVFVSGAFEGLTRAAARNGRRGRRQSVIVADQLRRIRRRSWIASKIPTAPRSPCRRPTIRPDADRKPSTRRPLPTEFADT